MINISSYGKLYKMRQTTYIILFLMFLFQSCAQEVKHKKITTDSISSLEFDTTIIVTEKKEVINPIGTTIKTRILPPFNFERTFESKHSYPEYLRQLPLKPHGTEVMFYDGTTKSNHNTYDAVIDLEIGKKDLHQCADAVMRLKAEYLWEQKKYEDIHFNFTNGFRVDYSEWMKGRRIVVKGNKSYWIDKESPSNTYQDFWCYMELIFNYAGTLSLSKELIPVEIKDIQIGDVFIWGGSPGHAVLVIDIAINTNTKEKIFLLAQSYMPAQEIQILQNPNRDDLSPWYSTEIIDKLITPEWTFSSTDLKRFKK